MPPDALTPRSSPYWPVVSHPLLRRVLPGLAVSALGDGMALIAVTWLAIQLAPPPQRGTWVAVAVAAYTLPSAAGTVLFGRLLSGRSGAQLAGWDAVLRAAALAAIPTAHLFGVLTIGWYVVLLAASSLLHSWGAAGRFTLIAELLPQRHHLPANAVLAIIGQVATIAGPPLAGILISWVGPVWVIAVDAVTFAVLAVTYRLAIPATGRTEQAGEGFSRTAGFAVIRHDRTLLGLLALTFGFFFLFGPFYVAMPIHVVEDLHAAAPALGLYYTAFGVGALVGGLATGYLRRWSLWSTTIRIVIGFGAAMLPLGLNAPIALSLPAFALAGLIWAPYLSTSMALFQRSTTATRLPQVLAARGAVTVLAVPLGTMLGGPLTATIGARQTLLLCAAATIALGVVAAGLTIASRKPPTDDHPPSAGPGPQRLPHPDAPIDSEAIRH
ncbi:MFS transporter [Micromonospora sp. DR5-3]|uniref:MFS transporter n=1 Tax=unclassified Micromonospora TaxID=2617518 RepID=UPI0011D7768E|nr:MULTISPECIES: MFS transporter [unclassified Micromonospora]MCW3816375.1 MFS transporter [Micromonospora sp. DR5-3]TYC22751.1 MFS transporter [Micromonospora sp. MP36]